MKTLYFLMRDVRQKILKKTENYGSNTRYNEDPGGYFDSNFSCYNWLMNR